jgi:hypothetical protein
MTTQQINVTFEVVPVVGCFYDYTFRLVSVTPPAPRPIKRSYELLAMAARAFNDSGTPAEVLS